MPGLAVGHSHGGVRGSELLTRSPLFEGRFGRMFRRLPPAMFSEAALHALATIMIAEAEDEPTPETEVDDEENQGIAAGFTYLGQFIDHDLTFDPASSLMKQNDPDALVDFAIPNSISTTSTVAARTINLICTRRTAATCNSAAA